MRLLIVEDHIGTIDNLGMVLSDAGWMVVRSLSAEDALAWLQQAPAPRIVIADHFLPLMTGLELLKTIRSNPAWAGIPFILMTAASDKDYEEIKAEFYGKGGGQLIMRKPFSPEELVKAVEGITGMKKVVVS